jgi:hypothetical protein
MVAVPFWLQGASYEIVFPPAPGKITHLGPIRSSGSGTLPHRSFYVYRLRDVLAERRTSSRPISRPRLRVTELVRLDR